MAGSITDRLLAKAPQIHAAIRESGDDYQILRFDEMPYTAENQPAAVRALVYQPISNPRTVSPGMPEFGVSGWQGIFLPDAPVRQRGFLVQAADGRLWWPRTDVADAGNQGVALFADLLLLPQRERTEMLTFMTEARDAQGNVLMGEDRYGNPVPAASVPMSVAVRLEASADPQIRNMVGADVAQVAFVGRWGTLADPQGKPQGVQWGNSARLVIDNQPGTLTVKLAYPDSDTANEQVLGARFVALWTAGNV